MKNEELKNKNVLLKVILNSSFLIFTFLTACSDFFEPVDSMPTPTEYSYNYWLLQRTYLFEDELPQLDENGDSVQELYSKLSDQFTRYVPPSKSEATITQINTSLVPGDVGMKYYLYPQIDHPIIISRVYPESPAGRAGIPRYGNILNMNGIEIAGENATAKFDSVLNHSKDLSIKVAYLGDTTTYNITKEDVYAPTVFIDTLNGTEVITITSFKLNTVDKENGTLGELTTYLNATRKTTAPRLIDLRNNPGGHVKHCTAMADLFIEEGTLSTRTWRGIAGNGTPTHNTVSEKAKRGDAGEGKKFMVLVNKNSASCAEIFAAALQEGAKIPIAGDTTYGKGIGQSNWKTLNGGLAVITNIEFLTPNGNSYHKRGIIPDYPCEDATLECGITAMQKAFGTRALAKQQNQVSEKTPIHEAPLWGGAFDDGEFQ